MIFKWIKRQTVVDDVQAECCFGKCDHQSMKKTGYNEGELIWIKKEKNEDINKLPDKKEVDFRSCRNFFK